MLPPCLVRDTRMTNYDMPLEMLSNSKWSIVSHVNVYVSHCSLEHASYLSITEQSLYKVVTPLLPRLCDLTDLQLILCHPAVNIRYLWSARYNTS